MRLIIEDAKNLKLKQDFLWIGTATLVTVIIWVSYSVYSAFNTSQTDPEIQLLLNQFNPNLDMDTLMSLEQKFIPPDDFTVNRVNVNPVSSASASVSR